MNQTIINLLSSLFVIILFLSVIFLLIQPGVDAQKQCNQKGFASVSDWDYDSIWNAKNVKCHDKYVEIEVSIK